MIDLIDVSKTYFNKNKRVEALKNINLKLLDAGMVFILGKSGSGKSTLLNILGGIDQATTGEVVIDGLSQKEFKAKDYAAYRNNYVGIVFQEFNLLHDLTVYENIALALQLSDKKNIDEKVADALEQVELSSEYFSRKIDELSGGEKQRIAIARTIVKDCNVILADEPTGNLDSKTGETIWKILKKQAESKLVIVVSHDRESANKYADRVIEISDGQIVSDLGSERKIETKKKISEKRNVLSGKVALKMAFNNLLKRKVRSLSVIILAIFTIFALQLTQMCLAYSSEKALARFIEKNDISYFSVRQGAENGGEFARGSRIVRQDTWRYLENESDFIVNGCVDSRQHMLDFGFSFIGEALELTETSYYVTDFMLERSYESPKSLVIIDGEKVKLVKELHSLDFLIGKQVDFGWFNSTDYILAGVVDTTDMNQLSRESLPAYFSLLSFSGKRISANSYNSNIDKEIILEYGDNKYDGDLTVGDYMGTAVGSFEGRILTEHGLQEYTDVTLSEGEIVLSYELYQALYSANSKWYYVDPELTKIENVPPELGQTFSLCFYEYGSESVILELGKYKIAGIGFSSQNYMSPSDNYTIIFDSATYRTIAQSLSQTNSMLIKSDSVKHLSSFLTRFRNVYQGYVSNVGKDVNAGNGFADIAYDFETEIRTFKQIFTLLSIVLMIVLLLFVINLITFSIHDRSKEIGILSALGTRNKDIVKIFIYETLCISTTSFVVDTLLSFAIADFFNAEYCKIFSFILPLFAVDWSTILGLFVVSFCLLLVFAWFPVRKIARMKPVDAIKNC